MNSENISNEAENPALNKGDVISRNYSKDDMKKAYIQGYRKRAIMSGRTYDNLSELNAESGFINWITNKYGL